MKFSFHKYQGTGNDFIMIDDRNQQFPIHDTDFIARCCDRRFGIGADGLILVQESTTTDFKMVYFNSDGRESTLCGNGARCTVAFAASLGIIKHKTTFDAVDGSHFACIEADHTISLRMHDIHSIECTHTHAFLDTGSPHHVTMVEDLPHYDVTGQGAKIRYGAPYFEEGANVNFVHQLSENSFSIRTYERGVEDETLSCGTGATAVAIAMHKQGHTSSKDLIIQVVGGELNVSFEVENNRYTAINLRGPAQFVFSGEFE